jgi:transcriptional regulator with XRE-family HTH domain
MAQQYLMLSEALKKLLLEYGMKPADLAREVNVPPPTIHRLLTGKSTRPHSSSLQPIADYFAIPLNELLGGTSTHEDVSQVVHHLPLIRWDDLPQLETLKNKPHKKMPYIGDINPGCFATAMPDSSMEPVFSRGDLFIFDPSASPQDRSYVLVCLAEGNIFTFRQLLIDLGEQYIKPLNADLSTFKIRKLNKQDWVMGTLIEARKIYGNH